jgi:hypothetical protein
MRRTSFPVLVGLIFCSCLQAQNLIPFMEKNRFGFLHKTNGRTVITPQFVFASAFKDSIAVAAIGNHIVSAQYGFINEKGKWVITPQFSAADQFVEGKARVQQNGKWGYINKKGKFVIQPQFNLCYSFTEGLAPASLKNNLWGLIDSTGKFVLQPVYYNITGVFAGIVCTQQNMTDHWEIRTIKNKTTIKTSFTRMLGFTDSLSAARDTSNKWGFVDFRGQWVIPPTYTNAGSFSEGLAAVQQDYKSWGFINKKGEWIIQPAFDRIGSFKNGLAMMEMGNDIVYINTEGAILYRFQRGY